MPYLGRESAAAQEIVGYFVNMLPMRGAVPRGKAAPSFEELVAAVMRKFRRALTYARAPFVRVGA